MNSSHGWWPGRPSWASAIELRSTGRIGISQVKRWGKSIPGKGDRRFLGWTGGHCGGYVVGRGEVGQMDMVRGQGPSSAGHWVKVGWSTLGFQWTWIYHLLAVLLQTDAVTSLSYGPLFLKSGWKQPPSQGCHKDDIKEFEWLVPEIPGTQQVQKKVTYLPHSVSFGVDDATTGMQMAIRRQVKLLKNLMFKPYSSIGCPCPPERPAEGE